MKRKKDSFSPDSHFVGIGAGIGAGIDAIHKIARTCQRMATTRARWRASTALRLIRVLDVLHEYVSALRSARALSSHALAPARDATR